MNVVAVAAGVIWLQAECEWIENQMQREFLVIFITNPRWWCFRVLINFFLISKNRKDPSHPAGKRKEIDNVMKKARLAPTNEYWDKKLLEAEEKDPGRWRHSGYKKMYVNGIRKTKSRSPVLLRKTPVSPVPRRRTPERYRPKSPPPRYARKSPPPRNDMKAKEHLAYRSKRPMSPPSKVILTLTN